MLKKLLLLLLGIYFLIHNVHSYIDEPRVSLLRKIGEIGPVFAGSNIYFWNIDDICCDDEGNLYVADSGWNKIFKFDSEGEYLDCWGRPGQGPGEFLAQPNRSPLRITHGNDGNIYITDSGNQRLSVFSKKGIFIRQYSLPAFYYDKPAVNSNGDIFLISNSNTKLIHVYDHHFNIKEKFFEKKKHFQYPYFKPPLRRIKANEANLIKKINKYDHIIVLSNFSLMIYHFDNRLNLINKFRVKDKQLADDLKVRQKKAKKNGGFILPFDLCLSEDSFAYLFYHNSKNEVVIYKYDLKGVLNEFYKFSEQKPSIFSINNYENIYAVIDDVSIFVYRKQTDE
jgi:hypothetical protein